MTSARSVRSTCRRTGRTNSSISTTIALASLASLRMSASSDCASFESGTCRRSRPAITSMPASGFFSSCAMPAAISPSDARRSRRRSRSSSCSTCVRSLKNSTAPIGAALVVLHLGQRVSDHAIEILQPQLRAVRQMAELERARQHANDFGQPLSTSENGRPTSSGDGVNPKIRYASSFIRAITPSRRNAMTPLRMLLTMWRKNRSSGAWRASAAAGGRRRRSERIRPASAAWTRRRVAGACRA